MRDISFRISKIPATRTTIARCGENLFTRLCVDMREWLAESPDAGLIAVYMRPDGLAYRVPVTVVDAQLIWSPTAEDTALSGDAALELQLLHGEIIGKSRAVALYIEPSINDVGLAPTPNEPLIYDKTYVHVQPIPAATWRVSHGLNKFPAVSVVDSAGTLLFGGVEYVNDNVIELRFSAPFSGRAFFN